MSEKIYNYSWAELIDRLNIVQMKSLFAQNNNGKFDQELSEIMHDIQVGIDEGIIITADVLRAIILLTQCNLSIWCNEDFIRSDETMSAEETADKLTYTHKLNANRSEFKTRIQNLIGGRTDEKINYQNGVWNIKW